MMVSAIGRRMMQSHYKIRPVILSRATILEQRLTKVINYSAPSTPNIELSRF